MAGEDFQRLGTDLAEALMSHNGQHDDVPEALKRNRKK